MTDELKFPGNAGRDRDSLDESIMNLVRDAYAPPGGDAYWAGLESRIMARVASEGSGDSPLAYDSVLQSVTPDVVATSEELISVGRGTDGATLSYFLSH